MWDFGYTRRRERPVLSWRAIKQIWPFKGLTDASIDCLVLQPTDPVRAPTSSNNGAIEIREGFMQRIFAKCGCWLGVAGMALTLAPDPTGVAGALGRAVDLLSKQGDAVIVNFNDCRMLLEVVEWSRACLMTDMPPSAWKQADKERDMLIKALDEALDEACAFVKNFDSANFGQRLVRGGFIWVR